MSVILIIDDEAPQREILSAILSEEGYETHTASSAEEGLKIINTLNPDVVLTDMKMKGMNGIELLDALPSDPARPAVIIMTAYGTIPSVVDAVKKGAFDYLEKPLSSDKVTLTVSKAVEMLLLVRENVRLKEELFKKFRIDGVIGESKRMKDAIEIVRKAAPAPVTVLISGESGTGKELIARAIHYNSPRKTYPFTAINCAAIPDSLIESELFGYEQGAFTGATRRKIGLFESSDRGTLFLDEVGDLSALTQTKILRVLQDREIRRLGGKDNIKVDVRIIAATNKDLEKEVAEGRFREDLYYRLRVVTVELPSLMERKEDIPMLVRCFLDKYNRDFGRRIKKVSEGAMNALSSYHWPGNIRQLESVIERAVLMTDTDTIDMDDIRSELRLPTSRGIMNIEIPDDGINFEDLEKELLKKAMTKANNVAAKAARFLGMSYKTFWYRLEKFGINPSLKEDIPTDKQMN
ncbi:MAG: sigma-54 dependent transcriptional regulator [Nitrospirae bacterium]|nr:sigma-54 dependent transcriptional regulator [Nitrospirota bacterium]